MVGIGNTRCHALSRVSKENEIVRTIWITFKFRIQFHRASAKNFPNDWLISVTQPRGYLHRDSYFWGINGLVLRISIKLTQGLKDPGYPEKHSAPLGIEIN